MRGAIGLILFVLPVFGAACFSAHDLDSPLSSKPVSSASANGASATGDEPVRSAAADVDCAKDPVNLDGLHQSFACAGLYADMRTKTLAPGVDPYRPGLILWSDGAQKNRWVYLPKGTKIDASVASDWVFPNGTKFFKEFNVNNHKVETRLFEKKDDFWIHTTYQWSDDEMSATRSDGGDITVDGQPYHLPTTMECDQCHKGRNDRALGFEQIALSVDGATGLTMAELVKKNLIDPVPATTTLAIADDGYGMKDVAGWLHMNCGVSCHNSNPNASGHSTLLRMRLDPSLLDGRPATDYDAFKTTIGVKATTPKWGGKIRIVPGDPSQSLLYQLITTRGMTGDNSQMPPIASMVVDDADVSFIQDWITSLPSNANGASPAAMQ